MGTLEDYTKVAACDIIQLFPKEGREENIVKQPQQCVDRRPLTAAQAASLVEMLQHLYQCYIPRIRSGHLAVLHKVQYG